MPMPCWPRAPVSSESDWSGATDKRSITRASRSSFLGRKLAATWQTGEAAIIAARVGVPVVSDFRPADMAVGGKGAPLVPFLDYMLFRDARVGQHRAEHRRHRESDGHSRRGGGKDVIAFDTGPGNMVMDAVTEKLFGQPFDRGGKIAASGEVLDKVIGTILRRAFFHRKPPKTAGREEFGREFVREFLRSCGRCRKAGCCGDGYGADREVDCGCSAAICA